MSRCVRLGPPNWSWYPDQLTRSNDRLVSCGSQPCHRLPEQGGSRRTQEDKDTRLLQFEYGRTLEDTSGYAGTRHNADSGPCVENQQWF